jgi:hypothetical protein
MVVAMTGGRELVVVDVNRGQSSGTTVDEFPHSTSTSGDNDEIRAGSKLSPVAISRDVPVLCSESDCDSSWVSSVLSLEATPSASARIRSSSSCF